MADRERDHRAGAARGMSAGALRWRKERAGFHHAQERRFQVIREPDWYRYRGGLGWVAKDLVRMLVRRCRTLSDGKRWCAEIAAAEARL